MTQERKTIIAIKTGDVLDSQKAHILKALADVGYKNVAVLPYTEAAVLYNETTTDMLICTDYAQVEEMLPAIINNIFLKQHTFKRLNAINKKEAFKKSIAALRRKR